MPSLLFVPKVPLYERLSPEAIARLDATGAMQRAQLVASAERQRRAIDAVRAALLASGCAVRERRIDELQPADAAGIDLVVTAGGDGTVFSAHALLGDVPFLTINSDPEGSFGHYTRLTADGVGDLLAAWLAGRARCEELPRLECRIGARSVRFLNDALFTNRNPAAMSRYRLDDGERCERQRSSGVWVATAAGSTGGIHSAGLEPLAERVPALLFKVREPFHAFGRLQVLEGRQVPPRGLVLTAVVPGMAVYIDGPNITLPLEPGESAEFRAAATPLRLLVP
ncbi:MAG: NAD(+)/NADH kinase [Planctomycetota bacterium]|nr:NAD(+)/NADH kinase [Planctomycetota bacterium]MCX8040354.1 NAD(+)/NADH kinase [Planctomycetota bacterium]MDW8373810.1 NAD(+)/NADH kinase [Planctomycetota bacterium]